MKECLALNTSELRLRAALMTHRKLYIETAAQLEELNSALVFELERHAIYKTLQLRYKYLLLLLLLLLLSHVQSIMSNTTRCSVSLASEVETLVVGCMSCTLDNARL